MAANERIAADTSVLVAAYLSGHELHQAAMAALDRAVAVPMHSILETYATLTALPAPYRQEPATVLEWLSAEFPSRLPYPAVRSAATMLRTVAAAGLRSGAVYDALIAETVREAGLRLLTADQRALLTYRRSGVDVDLVRRQD